MHLKNVRCYFDRWFLHNSVGVQEGHIANLLKIEIISFHFQYPLMLLFNNFQKNIIFPLIH